MADDLTACARKLVAHVFQRLERPQCLTSGTFCSWKPRWLPHESKDENAQRALCKGMNRIKTQQSKLNFLNTQS